MFNKLWICFFPPLLFNFLSFITDKRKGRGMLSGSKVALPLLFCSLHFACLFHHGSTLDKRGDCSQVEESDR